MSELTYDRIMGLLDVIECELDKIASYVGHCSYSEYISGDITGP